MLVPRQLAPLPLTIPLEDDSLLYRLDLPESHV